MMILPTEREIELEKLIENTKDEELLAKYRAELSRLWDENPTRKRARELGFI